MNIERFEPYMETFGVYDYVLGLRHRENQYYDNQRVLCSVKKHYI